MWSGVDVTAMISRSGSVGVLVVIAGVNTVDFSFLPLLLLLLGVRTDREFENPPYP